MKTAAIYARVSSDKQREEKTIRSQTATLVEFAKSKDYSVPDEWVIEDDGYSGANLVRPGLERVRDLAAEGQIQAVLVLSPDRLSRKYAYQVLLVEEFGRHGVAVVFVNSPQSDNPEDQLLLQFQGMIAEYERAQIIERSRRGKRHRAKQGEISVLSGAPYGYRYVRKTEEHAAYYDVIEAEAKVVREVYDLYTREAFSIGAITRRLNEQAIPTKKHGACWERSTVWAVLRNPAYKGVACFGKTKQAARSRVTRTSRLRGHAPARNSANHELPKDQWIEIPVPALISEDIFALAQERLEANKKLAPRRTIEPSVLQGIVHCRKCGYALYRSSTRSSARKIYYYRCSGSDAWRYGGVARCDCRPLRQDMLDNIVWAEVVRLLEDPTLIQSELDRRLEAARNSNPTMLREQALNLELAQVCKRMDRLLTAYQEDLLSLDELRHRMTELRQRENSLKAELQALSSQVVDQATYLRLAQTLAAFLHRLQVNAQDITIEERQQITRLVIKEVIVDHDSITIRHSIPNAIRSPGGKDGLINQSGNEKSTSENCSLLRPWSERPALRHAHPARPDNSVYLYSGPEIASD